MNINCNDFSTKIERTSVTTVVKDQNSISFTYKGGVNIGSQAYMTIDLSGVDIITCSVTTGNSYSDSDSRFKIYLAIVSTSFNLANNYISNNLGQMIVSDVFSSRNDSTTMEIDVSNLTGEYQLCLSVAGWTVSFSNIELITIQQYTVCYHSNGGIGTMADQIIYSGVPTPLSKNLFTRTNYLFNGWSQTPNGEVWLIDEAVVLDLAQPDSTVNLYAVWTRTPLQIILQETKSEPICVEKIVREVLSITGVLREETSVIDPIILIRGDVETLLTVNYLTIPAFGNRSYFVKNINIVRQGLVEMQCHVDVLYTYRSGIKQNKAIIARNEIEYDLKLNDGLFQTQQNPRIAQFSFPSGFNTWNFVLAVAGN